MRPKTMTDRLPGITLPGELAARLRDESRLTGTPQAELIRQAIDAYLPDGSDTIPSDEFRGQRLHERLARQQRRTQ